MCYKGTRRQFVAAVANDGRSYSNEVFMNALEIMKKQHGLRPAFPQVRKLIIFYISF